VPPRLEELAPLRVITNRGLILRAATGHPEFTDWRLQGIVIEDLQAVQSGEVDGDSSPAALARARA